MTTGFYWDLAHWGRYLGGFVHRFGLRAHACDGRLGILMLAGAGLAYLAAKIVGTGKPTT